MFTVLLKSLAFALALFLGWLVKRVGFLNDDDRKSIAKVVLNITLPASILRAFSGFVYNKSLVILVVFGFTATLIPLIVSYFLSAKKPDEDRIFYMLNSSGYNIGAFSFPFVQSFLASIGSVSACLFDAGHALLVTGGSYAIVSFLFQNKITVTEKPSLIVTVKKLFSSVPFDFYLLAIFIMLFNIKLPPAFFLLLEPIANANPFLALFMIGLMIKKVDSYESIKKIGTVLAFRFSFSIVFALIFYFLTPFAHDVRATLVLLVFSPTSVLAPLFIEKLRGDAHLAGITGTISVIFSLVSLIILVTIMGL